MKFRFVFWDVLPCKITVNNYFTRQYIPEDNSEHQRRSFIQVSAVTLSVGWNATRRETFGSMHSEKVCRFQCICLYLFVVYLTTHFHSGYTESNERESEGLIGKEAVVA
jgi:hypothetical protein